MSNLTLTQLDEIRYNGVGIGECTFQFAFCCSKTLSIRTDTALFYSFHLIVSLLFCFVFQNLPLVTAKCTLYIARPPNWDYSEGQCPLLDDVPAGEDRKQGQKP